MVKLKAFSLGGETLKRQKQTQRTLGAGLRREEVNGVVGGEPGAGALLFCRKWETPELLVVVGADGGGGEGSGSRDREGTPGPVPGGQAGLVH